MRGCARDLLMICFAGYGPPSPVEFGSNEVGSHEQYSAPIDFSSYNTGSFGSGGPASYSAPSTAYKSGPPSFSPHFSGGGGGGSGNYKGGLGGKGGVSSSYISIVHGAGGSGGPGKLRPAPYSAASKGPAPVLNSYSPPSFGNAAAFTDVKSFGGASPYGSGEVYGNSFNKAAYSGSPSYSASYESYSPSGSEYNKGYENGGISDEVASYTSGGPSYASFTGGSKASYTPTFSQGSRGNAFSTSNVNVLGGKGSAHGSFQPPSYTGSFKPSGGAKVYSRYTGQSSGFGPSSSSYSAPSSSYSGPSSSSYSAPSFGNGESGYNSRALKTGYGSENAEEFGSSEDSNVFNGAFGDGAGFKVQSSYSSNFI